MKAFILQINNTNKGVFSSIYALLEFIEQLVNVIDKPFLLSDILIITFKLNSSVILNKLEFRPSGIYNNDSKYYISRRDYGIFKRIANKLTTELVQDTNIYIKQEPKITSTIPLLSESSENLDSEEEALKEELANKKSEINYQLKLLEKEKNRLEESKRVFQVDLNIYERLKEEYKQNPELEIPFLFQDKFPIFVKLESEDKLNWENFIDEYTPRNIGSSYDGLFNDQESFFDGKIDLETTESSMEDTSDSDTSENVIISKS